MKSLLFICLFLYCGTFSIAQSSTPNNKKPSVTKGQTPPKQQVSGKSSNKVSPAPQSDKTIQHKTRDAKSVNKNLKVAAPPSKK